MAGFCADEVKHNPKRGFAGGYYMETLVRSCILSSFDPGAWEKEFADMMDGYENIAGMWIVGEDIQSKTELLPLLMLKTNTVILFLMFTSTSIKMT